MLDQLRLVEDKLLELMEEEDAWHTIDVDYEPPRVERVWRTVQLPIKHNESIGEYEATVTTLVEHRVCLHRIHPCETALFHPHPWPSAMRVVGGTYEMVVGQADDYSATIILAEGSTYEMTSSRAWHSVRPLDACAWSLMVMGPKYTVQDFDHTEFGAGREFKPLTQQAKDFIMNTFAGAYRHGYRRLVDG